MFLIRLLRAILLLCAPLCFLSTAYLYAYPVFKGCAFPTPESLNSPSSSSATPHLKNAFLNTVLSHTPLSGAVAHRLPTFRLLAVGDPQLEGSTSIDLEAENFPHFHKVIDVYRSHDLPLKWRIGEGLKELGFFVRRDLWSTIKNYRKRVDLWGNDLYIKHLVRIISWWTKPTHVSVLGDLLGSQWIDDSEFEARTWRFWHRVFPEYSKIEERDMHRKDRYGGVRGKKIHKLGVKDEEAEQWTKRLINLPGNHDIGYGGDITKQRVERYESAFGPVNYELEFYAPVNVSLYNRSLDEIPKLRVVVLNNMNLDAPVLDTSLQSETYTYINSVIAASPPVGTTSTFTLLLTHIPLHKKAGVCVDGPLFRHHTTPNREDILPGGIQEQNHLSEHSSNGILTGIFGMSSELSAPAAGVGRPGMVLTGHDHEGCDVWHFVNQTLDTRSVNSHKLEKSWEALRIDDAKEAGIPGAPEMPGLREVTVRSAMGDFGGNIGLLSLSFNAQTWEWESQFSNCALGHTAIWWTVHIADLIVFGLATVWYVLDFLARINPSLSVQSRDREQERRDWLAGRGYRDIYGRPMLDGKGRGGKARPEREGERPRSRGKDTGSGSGSDSGSGTDRPRRRASGNRKVSLRDKMGGGRRQLSAVLEMPEHEHLHSK